MAEVFQAFRDQNIPIGVYFSPDDFYWLREQGKPILRNVPEVQPKNNPGLMAYDQAQVKELFTKYGAIQVAFFDGQADGLRDLAWKLQPNVVVSRGAVQTPEQYVPGMPLKGVWEANLTMGASWMYQPQGDAYKSTRQLLDTLIQTRAKGGNLLLDIGPKANGEIPIEEEDRLREMGLWMSVNSDCIYGVRPWVITNEGDLWFTRKKDEDTLYVIDDSPQPWVFGKWRDAVLEIGTNDGPDRSDGVRRERPGPGVSAEGRSKTDVEDRERWLACARHAGAAVTGQLQVGLSSGAEADACKAKLPVATR